MYKMYRDLLNFLLVITPVIVTAKFYRQKDKTRLSAYFAQKTRASSLQCAHFCTKKDECHGFNYNKEQRKCELFTKTQYEDVAQNTDTEWTIHFFQKPPPEKNRCGCINDGKCVEKLPDRFICQCPTNYIGKRCKIDIGFALSFPTPQSLENYAQVSVPSTKLPAFTVCLTIWIHEWSNKMRSVFSYQPKILADCSRLCLCPWFELKYSEKSYEFYLFGKRLPIQAIPIQLPVPTCVSWDSVNGALDITMSNKTVFSDVTLKGQIMEKDGSLVLGKSRSGKGTECLDGLAEESFVGKIAHVFMYNRKMQVDEMMQYQRKAWVVDSNLVASWQQFKYPGSIHGHVTITEF